MRTNTVLVAALATVVTTVAAVDGGRPRIYFPRHIKRQYTNATSTTGDDSASVTAVGVPLGDDSSSSAEGLLGGLLGGGSADGSSTSSSSSSSASKSASKTGTSNQANGSKVTTVVIASTIVVPPKAAGTGAASATGSGEDADATPSTGKVANSTSTDDDGSSLSIPPLIVLPTLGQHKTATPTGLSNSTASSKASDSSSSTYSTTSKATTSSESGILLAPTGVVSSTATTDDDPLGLGGLISGIIGGTKSTANATETSYTGKPTATEGPTTTDQGISIPLTLLPPGTGSSSSSAPTGTAPPDTTIPPPVTNATETVPPTVTLPPTDPTSIPDVNSTVTELPPTTFPTTTVVTIPGNTTTYNNTSPTAAPTYGDTTITSPSTTTTVTQPYLPTTIVVDPTPTTTTSAPGLAPTSAVTLPTALPKAITPDGGNEPPPEDTTLIQIGFGFGMNYPFIVSNSKAAAQIFQLLPTALSYAGGFPVEKVQMRKLIPLNTQQSLGYVTTLAIVTYPSNMVEALRMDVKIPSSPLYNHPEQLVYNLTQQINSAIDIILGSYPEDGAAPGSGDGESSSSSTSVPNSDPFDNDNDDSSESSSSQKGATAGIAFGVVGVAAAYGAAMFVIARRYKRKKQAHRRASSISDSSGMRTVGSPALMGGALLSRDFSSYGGVSGGVAGGRDSQGSGRSGGNSARTAVISAPMAAENSLGWN